MFVFDLLSGKIKCSELLEKLSFNVNPHSTRSASLIYSKAHRIEYMALTNQWKDA
jgi:hypothetical protein